MTGDVNLTRVRNALLAAFYPSHADPYEQIKGPALAQLSAAEALVFDMADALRAINDPELSDLSDTAFHWHGMHTANREDEAEDCIVCRVRVLLARLDRISTQTERGSDPDKQRIWDRDRGAGSGSPSASSPGQPRSACVCDPGDCGEDCGTA